MSSATLPSPGPGQRRQFSVVLLALLLAGIANCGGVTNCSGSTVQSAYQIVAPSTPIVTGSTQQFSITDGTDVVWGLSESDPVQPAGQPVYPLKVSANGRYLVDQQGHPWRVQADAAWLLSTQATPTEVDDYLTTREAQGFNSFYLMAMVHPNGYAAAPDAPNDRQGDPPFATPGDFSTAGASAASERYWQWIDSIIDKAAAHHMVVMLAYTYLGYNGEDQGWYKDVLAQPSRQALFDWGTWLGRRYKDRPNIVWFGLGDFTPPAGSEGALRTRAIADGIKAAGAEQLFMAEPSSPDGIPGEVTDFAPVLDMNSFYGYGPDGIGTVYETADRAWRENSVKPAWMQEGTYEYENNSGHFSAQPWDTRRGRFWSVLAGGTAGDGFGSKNVWPSNDIPASLSSPGADYSKYAFELFATMPWWDLRPSGTDPGFAGVDLITSGRGTWGGQDLITAALTAQRDWLLAYVPVTNNGPRTFTVDMSAMAGPARARWFDPATGNYIAITAGDPYPNSGTQSFTTPGGRADGTNDWLLVLDSAGTAPCGSITPSGLYTAPMTVPAGVECEVTATSRSDPSVVARLVITIEAGG